MAPQGLPFRNAFRIVAAVWLGLMLLGFGGALAWYLSFPENPAATASCRSEQGRSCRACCKRNGAHAAMSGPLTCSCRG